MPHPATALVYPSREIASTTYRTLSKLVDDVAVCHSLGAFGDEGHTRAGYMEHLGGLVGKAGGVNATTAGSKFVDACEKLGLLTRPKTQREGDHHARTTQAAEELLSCTEQMACLRRQLLCASVVQDEVRHFPVMDMVWVLRELEKRAEGDVASSGYITELEYAAYCAVAAVGVKASKQATKILASRGDPQGAYSEFARHVWLANPQWLAAIESSAVAMVTVESEQHMHEVLALKPHHAVLGGVRASARPGVVLALFEVAEHRCTDTLVEAIRDLHVERRRSSTLDRIGTQFGYGIQVGLIERHANGGYQLTADGRRVAAFSKTTVEAMAARHRLAPSRQELDMLTVTHDPQQHIEDEIRAVLSDPAALAHWMDRAHWAQYAGNGEPGGYEAAVAMLTTSMLPIADFEMAAKGIRTKMRLVGERLVGVAEAAPGGEADAVLPVAGRVVLVEATGNTDEAQFNKELNPTLRHAVRACERTLLPVSVVFVAPSIDPRMRRVATHEAALAFAQGAQVSYLFLAEDEFLDLVTRRTDLSERLAHAHTATEVLSCEALDRERQRVELFG